MPCCAFPEAQVPSTSSAAADNQKPDDKDDDSDEDDKDGHTGEGNGGDRPAGKGTMVVSTGENLAEAIEAVCAENPAPATAWAVEIVPAGLPAATASAATAAAGDGNSFDDFASMMAGEKCPKRQRVAMLPPPAQPAGPGA